MKPIPVRVGASYCYDTDDYLLYSAFESLSELSDGELFWRIERGVWNSQRKAMLRRFIDRLLSISGAASLEELGEMTRDLESPHCLLCYDWTQFSIGRQNGSYRFEVELEESGATPYDFSEFKRDLRPPLLGFLQRACPSSAPIWQTLLYRRDDIRRLQLSKATVKELEQLGLFALVKSDDLEQLRSRMTTDLFRGRFEDNEDELGKSFTKRTYAADSEDLLDDGALGFFVSSRAVWRHAAGCYPQECVGRYKPGEQQLAMGDYRGVVRSDHLESDLIRLCNNWLQSSGSEERAFGISSGNDFCVRFLTRPMVECLRNSGLLAACWLPSE